MTSNRFMTLATLAMTSQVAVLALAPTAIATPHTTAPADAWASFATPAAGLPTGDTVQWYASTPTITSSMVRRAVTLRVISPATLDCTTLGLGFGVGTGWTSVKPRSVSCTSTTVTESFVATRAMVGHTVALNGWTATRQRSATITATVMAKGRTSSVSVATTRPTNTTPAASCTGQEPVGPLRSFGKTTDGRDIAVASANGINEVWIDGTQGRCYVAPSGVLLDRSRYALVPGPVGIRAASIAVYSPERSEITWWSLSVEVPASLPAPSGIPSTSVTTGVTGSYYALKVLAYHDGSRDVELIPLDGSPLRTVRFTTGYVQTATTNAADTTITYIAAPDPNTSRTCHADLSGTDCPATFTTH